ncbi:DUF2267 domain-containing protein [Streptomyces sp. NPDC046942]|uniref:DUF2267 domain-containing protein n=1 Tax=Streptomyces sp. NPDC046942 TaxID=3155137 RepID=UPI0033E5A11E
MPRPAASEQTHLLRARVSPTGSWHPAKHTDPPKNILEGGIRARHTPTRLRAFHPQREHLVKAVSEALETEDRHFAHRVLRTFRDRLTVDVAAHFAAQLPELVRGAYYDGWDPNVVPAKYDRRGYVDRFVQEAKVTAEDVPQIAAAVTAVVREHVSPGHLEAAMEQIPHDIRSLLLQPPGRACTG